MEFCDEKKILPWYKDSSLYEWEKQVQNKNQDIKWLNARLER